MSKNYITLSGLEKLKKEFHELLHVERPKVVEVVSWAAGNGDRSENGDYIYGKRRLREIDRRIHYLTKRLEDAEVVDPLKIRSEKILFSAHVTLEYESGEEKIFQIVGEDEIHPEMGKISWKSPIGRALLGKAVGDSFALQLPKGSEEVEITQVQYKA